MVYIAIAVGLLMVIFLLKYILQKRQIKLLYQQLQQGQETNNYQKIYCAMNDQSIEKLASQINELIQHEKDIKATSIRKENNLKEAIASMSHDLRTPLTSIIGYLQLLERESLTNKQQNYLIAANQRAQHLEKLVNNFFSLSAVDSAKESLTATKVDLLELVKEVVFTFYDDFQKLMIEPEFKMPNQPVFIMADESASYRVLENIVLNALQHSTLNLLSEEANFEIDLSTQGNSAVLSVSNTMIDGSVDAKKVFQQFYTGDKSRENNGGLGLTIVKSLMEKMGGEVDVFVKDNLFTVVCRFKLN